MKNKSINNTFSNLPNIELNVGINSFIHEKILYIQKIIQNTILSIQQNKILNIFSNNDIDICIATLGDIYSNSCSLIEDNKDKPDSIVKSIQEIIDNLIIIICGFGTKNIEDILYLVFGNTSIPFNQIIIENKFSLIKNYLHPIGFKIIPWKNGKNNKIKLQNKQILYCQNKWNDENKDIHYYNNFECFDIDYNEKSFYYKIYGIQTIIKNEKLQKTIIINCVVDDILLDFFSNSYIDHRKINILENMPKNDLYDLNILSRLIDSLSLKDYLIYGNEDIYKNYLFIINDVQLLKTNKIDITIKNFLDLDLLIQRKYLINILIYNKEPEIHYIAYLLYDLLNVQNNDLTETIQQKILYDSFPYKIKQYLKNTMSITMKYSQDMILNHDVNKISLEQQVFLFKAPPNIKEKAIMKLKEIKSKSDDISTKTKQYLEGLLRIPFQNYRNEPILKINKINNKKFISLFNNHKQFFNHIQSHQTETETNDLSFLKKKDFYTKIEIRQNIQKIEHVLYKFFFKNIEQKITNANNKLLIDITHFLKNIENIFIEKLPNNLIHSFQIQLEEIIKTTTKQKRIQLLLLFIDFIHKNIVYNIDLLIQICKIYELFEDNLQSQLNSPSSSPEDFPQTSKSLNVLQKNKKEIKKNNIFEGDLTLSKIPEEIKDILNNNKKINNYLDNITETLDDSIYGHSHAKNQILKIFSQWMTGEHNGYCFGFEGSPGIGKTSLAKKGLSKCLVDENGVARPFSFIALGGSCNGSILEGHSFTYVNSSWGRIVDILMDTKCMNPIIYIDELDKVSKTEHGREIIGILTHLIDSTQNDGFQDKYFSGIDLDLSKVLFIFSYNDPEQIDKVLLDRIHRIKFDNISLTEKIVIVEKYILPEINKKLGFQDTVVLSNNTIEYIIEHYTMEPGVRKLKEVLFDLYGEINIQILKDENNIQIPIVVQIDDIETKYLKKYKKLEDKLIHTINKIGIINGLWANSLGKGGIIPIEAVFFPSTTFLDFKLTGLQGDVMKESMNVAKSLAWSLCDENIKKDLIKSFETTKCQGIHIHCPEGGVSKDGPSAGSAITIAIYSLLNKKKIKNDIAITGEINLQGDITAIGGLDLKIMGGVRSGVKTFIYPYENQNDFDEIMKKQSYTINQYDSIKFISVKNIQDVLQYIFEEL